jgi:hypothetical protein
MDPAVLGTLRIGLDALDADARPHRPRPHTAGSRSAWTGLRATLAAALRLVADHLEPRPTAGAVR